ncbi:GNAT family N-acetyltransferase [Antribacter gilvus]|uniref:GNAT family N-acetyltransferase n=1 Tax=Antribacter gilvus TaxID=2304675 RepID=UPI00197D3E96|nr:GNAT family N-acetyltransferase [Antribacter gilvus]
MTLTIRAAQPSDVLDLHRFILALAQDEEFPGKVTARPDDLEVALFGPEPAARAVVAERDGAAIGSAIYVFGYSTITGCRTLHLDDLYVVPEQRDRGVGRRLLAELARIAVDGGCSRFEWWVLRTNEPALRLYRRLGARTLDEIDVMRLEGTPLAELASAAEGPAGPEQRGQPEG